MTPQPDIPLWIMIGLPGSGKSTWAARFSRNTPPLALIATDQIRQALFGEEAIQGPWMCVWTRVTHDLQQAVWQTRQDLLAGAIYDATNTQRQDRQIVLQTARRLGFTRLMAVWCDSPLAICLDRNQRRSRHVPEAVIQTMARQLAGAPPHCDEGFDAVYRLWSQP
jgi:predicted kinase